MGITETSSGVTIITNEAAPAPTLIVTEEGTVNILTVIERGPQGIPGIDGVIGIDGLPGVDAVGAIPGSYTGDFLRWNSNDNSWEVKSEPIEFNGLVLTPALASIVDAEGALYYNSTQKSVLVCTDT